MTQLTASEKKKRLYKFAGGAAAAAVALFFIISYFLAPQKLPTDSKLTNSGAEAIANKAGGEASPEYNNRLKEHDDKKANEALTSGKSHVPTPTGQRKPIVGQKEEQKTPPPPPVATVRTTAAKPVRQDNPMLKRMMEDLAQLDSKLNATGVGHGKIEYIKETEKEAKAKEKEVPAPSSSQKILTGFGVKPGDLLYAIVDTGVNSDVPSAVLATVASGKFRNARLMGSFQRFDERIVLSFTRLVMPDGKVLQLDAYAVDPGTSEASVATSVNTHFFERWGGLIASSFLSGLGEAKRFSGAQSNIYGTVNGTSDQMIWKKYNPADQAWIAAGKVGEKAAEKFERNFDRPPTVYLASGTAIGVLVMNVKESR